MPTIGQPFKGNWNASTNVPALASGLGPYGGFYRVSVTGNTVLDAVTAWVINDLALFDGTYWRKVGADYMDNDIGIAGGIGFGAGVCPPGRLPAGMVPMTNYNILGADNYGNYQFSDGSVMVYVPKFYYKIGTGTNGLAVNVIDVKGTGTYPSTVAANAAGYALHRAFIDGGVEKDGFFIDKYMISKNALGTGFVGSSIKNGLPISTGAAHNPATDLTGGVSVYYSLVDLAHRRDGINGLVNVSSIFFCASQFQRSALAVLSMAHGQAATGTTYCAWYSAGTTNFPKGCNNDALHDCDDASVVYITDGYSNCGQTGSGSPFAKTTHNGQNCGVADLNGLMYEVSLGITYDSGTSKFYVAKQATAMKSFTAGATAATDHWGATGIAAMMDEITLPVFGANGWIYPGNGANQVLSEAISGNSWLLTGLGVPKDTNAVGAGTALFGVDGQYWIHTNQLCLLASAGWNDGTRAGVWSLGWDGSRTDNYYLGGGRFGTYPV